MPQPNLNSNQDWLPKSRMRVKKVWTKEKLRPRRPLMQADQLRKQVNPAKTCKKQNQSIHLSNCSKYKLSDHLATTSRAVTREGPRPINDSEKDRSKWTCCGLFSVSTRGRCPRESSECNWLSNWTWKKTKFTNGFGKYATSSKTVRLRPSRSTFHSFPTSKDLRSL